MVLYQSSVVLNVVVLLLSTTLLVSFINNYTLHLTFWGSKACQQECLQNYFGGPPNYRDTALIELVREKYLLPPPRHPEIEDFDINNPPWARLLDWNLLQQKLLQIWKDQPPGVFVEVGAADGEFMSHTIVLERNLSWTGLLIEADPRNYAKLKERRRNAWISPLCIHHSLPAARRYWLRNVEEDLPEHFKQLLMGRSKLNDEILVGDEEQGTTVMVSCVPLYTLLLAARITTIDLLTVSTDSFSDEERIANVVRTNAFDIKTILVHFPMGILTKNPYPAMPGYIMDVEHSNILIKLYIKQSHCKLISKNECKRVNYHDSRDSCYKYLCFGFLIVHSVSPKLYPKKV